MRRQQADAAEVGVDAFAVGHRRLGREAVLDVALHLRHAARQLVLPLDLAGVEIDVVNHPPVLAGRARAPVLVAGVVQPFDGLRLCAQPRWWPSRTRGRPRRRASSIRCRECRSSTGRSRFRSRFRAGPDRRRCCRSPARGSAATAAPSRQTTPSPRSPGTDKCADAWRREYTAHDSLIRSGSSASLLPGGGPEMTVIRPHSWPHSCARRRGCRPARPVRHPTRRRSSSS